MEDAFEDSCADLRSFFVEFGDAVLREAETVARDQHRGSYGKHLCRLDANLGVHRDDVDCLLRDDDEATRITKLHKPFK